MLGLFFAAPPSLLAPVWVMLTALLLDVFLGDRHRFFFIIPHPVVLLGQTISWLETRLNRSYRPDSDRLIRGTILCLALCLGTGALGLAIHVLACVSLPFLILEIFLIYALIAQRSLFDHVRMVADALETGGIVAGRDAVSRIVGRDVTHLDENAVARAAIESCAENFSDGIVAPLFWALLFGLPGLMIYKTVNTLDSMIGHRSARYLYFGRFSARFDDVLNWIPARLSAFFIICAAFLTRKDNPRQALLTVRRDASRHPSPNSGWPEAAMAGALDLSLGGPRSYGSGPVEGHWIGTGRTEAQISDIRRALKLYSVACLLNALFVLAGLAFF